MEARTLWCHLKDYDGWLFILMLGTLIASNVVAYFTHIRFKESLGPDRGSVTRPAKHFQQIFGRDMAGRQHRIAFDRKTLLFIFSTECRRCPSEIRYWNELARALRSNDVAVYGLSLDTKGLAQYLADHNVEFPVLVNVGLDTMIEYGINRTPLTIVVSKEGVLEDFFSFLDDSNSRERIESSLGI